MKKKSVCFIEIENAYGFFYSSLGSGSDAGSVSPRRRNLAERGSGTRLEAGCTGSNRARASRRRPLRDCRRYRSSRGGDPRRERPREDRPPDRGSQRAGQHLAEARAQSGAPAEDGGKEDRQQRDDHHEPEVQQKREERLRAGKVFSTSALICWPKPPSTNERIIISSMPSV